MFFFSVQGSVVPQPQIPLGRQGLPTCQQNSSNCHDSSYGHINTGDSSSWQKGHQDQSRCYHSSSANRLPSLTEEQRVQQYQNNQHLNVEGWPLLPSAQSSQTQFMTLGRRTVPTSQHRCERGQLNHRLNALSRFVLRLQYK